MSDATQQSPTPQPKENYGLLLTTLMQRWWEQFPKRATGGFWALSGFSFKASIYLLRFFRELGKGTTEPGLLAEMEHLSDITCPSDDRLTLIQVKRTLTKQTLLTALEEPDLLTGLCRAVTPALFVRVRFQDVCRSKTQGITLTGAKLQDVLESGGDQSAWAAMLGAFDTSDPMLEQPDPIDQLHVLFWNAGIQDMTAMIERCTGRLLAGFERRVPDETRGVGRELADLYNAAPRRPNWAPVGRFVMDEDVMIIGMALKSKGLERGLLSTHGEAEYGFCVSIIHDRKLKAAFSL